MIEVVRGNEVLQSNQDGIIELPVQYGWWAIRWKHLPAGEPGEAPWVMLGGDDRSHPQWQRLRWDDRQGGWVLPNSPPASGWIRLADEPNGEPLTPAVFVGAAQFSLADYHSILNDLRDLANATSAYWINRDAVRSPTPLEVQIERLEVLVAELAAVRTAMPRSGRSLTLHRRSSGQGVAFRDRRALIAQLRQAGRPTVRHWSVSLAESSDIEIWLEYLTGLVRRDIERLADLVGDDQLNPEEAAVRLDAARHELIEHVGRIFEGWELPVPLASPSSRMPGRVNALRATMSGFTAPQTHRREPAETNAWKLGRGTAGLRSAYRRYREAVPELAFVEGAAGARSRSVHSTHELYERWVLWKIYVGLLDRAFRPTEDRVQSLVDSAGPEEPMRLQHREDPSIEIEIWRQPWLELEVGRTVNPDIVLDLRVANGTVTRYIVDAKYHAYGMSWIPARYAEEAKRHHDSWFLGTMHTTCREKYCLPHRHPDGTFRPPAAAVIVHPTRGREFRWTGGRPIADHPHVSHPAEEDRAFVTHAYGAFNLHPGDRSGVELSRMFWMFFGFHGGLTEYCWSCGRRGRNAEVLRNGKALDPAKISAGHVRFCQPCAKLWIEVWCNGSGHHSLLKLGADGFHEQAEGAESSHMVLCPTCGATALRGSAVAT